MLADADDYVPFYTTTRADASNRLRLCCDTVVTSLFVSPPLRTRRKSAFNGISSERFLTAKRSTGICCSV